LPKVSESGIVVSKINYRKKLLCNDQKAIREIKQPYSPNGERPGRSDHQW
jgi:hypothetical protein